MRFATQEINADLGRSVLSQAGMAQKRIAPVAAVYANLHNLGAAGMYPVLFHATVDAATTPAGGGESVFDKAWQRIAEDSNGDEPLNIKTEVVMAWLRIAPGGAPLRQELLEAFAVGKGAGVQMELSKVSLATRLRSGLQYLDFLLAVLAAAGIDHLFVFVDQLEDLATNGSITSSKRSKEIGRIRDLIETEPYGSRLHFVFTFHNSAGRKLEGYWEANRLPSFENTPGNAASVVTLRGLSNDEQVAEVLRVYLDSSRTEVVEDDLLPFDESALTVLRQVSQGRIGILLSKANELIEAGASRGLARIDGTFAVRHLTGRAGTADYEEDGEISTSDIDDLLLS
jgi:hypothetical protein